jgi:hypothetical protein
VSVLTLVRSSVMFLTQRDMNECHWQRVGHTALDTAAVRGELEYEPGDVAVCEPCQLNEFLA